MGKVIDYARVSTAEQDLQMQLVELDAVGCDRVFSDTASGAKSSRPGLDECLKALREGDTLLVWRLDRLGRSVSHLIELVNGLKEKGVGFRSLYDGAIDTTRASCSFTYSLQWLSLNES